jgi:hypothetical protein
MKQTIHLALHTYSWARIHKGYSLINNEGIVLELEIRTF